MQGETTRRRGTSGDGLREHDEVLVPDSRWESVVRVEQSGELRPMTLADHRVSIDQLQLHEGVPLEVWAHFETVRNLLLYSWFVYRFIPVAEQHAYSAIELALKIRLGFLPWQAPRQKDDAPKQQVTRSPGLKGLLKQAVKEGLLKDEGYAQVHRLREQRAKWAKSISGVASVFDELGKFDTGFTGFVALLLEVMPQLRNDLAHGSLTLGPGGHLALSLACDTINQLFDCSESCAGSNIPAPLAGDH